MPRDVKKSIVDICSSCGCMSQQDAENLVQAKIKNKEYLVEAWS
jgi:sulfite reductase alpha subunit-like flavoprotein